MTAILGISAFYHDSAAALVVDGEIVAAAHEERFTRKKHDHDFPVNAIRYCLEEARLGPDALDYVGFYDKPFLKFERLLETYLRGSKLSEAKRRAWFADQYRHPHESRHTIGEVQRWFAECGLEFVRGVPSVLPADGGLGPGQLFEPAGVGSRWDHFRVQARQVIAGSREGGFFLMIGRKPARPAEGRTAKRRMTLHVTHPS